MLINLCHIHPPLLVSVTNLEELALIKLYKQDGVIITSIVVGDDEVGRHPSLRQVGRHA